MQSVTFIYQGKHQAGNIAANTQSQPFYYWLFLTDEELIHEIGDDSVAFVYDNNKLENCNRIPAKHNELVSIASILIAEYISKGNQFFSS